jgi:hypothetical protein
LSIGTSGKTKAEKVISFSRNLIISSSLICFFQMGLNLLGLFLLFDKPRFLVSVLSLFINWAILVLKKFMSPLGENWLSHDIVLKHFFMAATFYRWWLCGLKTFFSVQILIFIEAMANVKNALISQRFFRKRINFNVKYFYELPSADKNT